MTYPEIAWSFLTSKMVFDLAWQMLSSLVRIPKIPTAMIDEKQIIPIIKWAVSEFFY